MCIHVYACENDLRCQFNNITRTQSLTRCRVTAVCCHLRRQKQESSHQLKEHDDACSKFKTFGRNTSKIKRLRIKIMCRRLAMRRNAYKTTVQILLRLLHSCQDPQKASNAARYNTKLRFKYCSDIFARIGLRLVVLHSEKIGRFTSRFKMGRQHSCPS
jgi:hypothetical protein